MKNQLPNILTCLNLLSGCIAIVVVLQGGYTAIPLALFFVVIAAIFDFFDGFTARLLNIKNIIGKDLDSLADCVSFGVVPSCVVYVFLKANINILVHSDFWAMVIPYVAFLLAIFSALRLAKFNNDERQTDSFIGLNTPANTLFWVSFCSGLSIRALDGSIYVANGLILTIIGLVFVFSYLLISEIPMSSLKVKSLKFQNNMQRYFLAFFLIILFPFLGYLSIAATIVLYIVLSLFNLKRESIW